MTTIYNLLHPNEQAKGVVEIFNMYDYSHYLIVLDGNPIDTVEDSDYESFILEYKFIKKLIKKSGVAPSDLLFVHYEFEIFARSVIDYDMNNFGYQEMYNLVSNNLSHSQNLQTKILYHGVTI